MQLPHSLASKVVEGALPWSDAEQLHIEDFLRRYTLHDSHWLSLILNCGSDDSAVAVILLDSVWNPTTTTVLPKNSADPLLFIRFNSVSNVQLAGFHNIGNIQRGITEVIRLYSP